MDQLQLMEIGQSFNDLEKDVFMVIVTQDRISMLSLDHTRQLREGLPPSIRKSGRDLLCFQLPALSRALLCWGDRSFAKFRPRDMFVEHRCCCEMPRTLFSKHIAYAWSDLLPSRRVHRPHFRSIILLCI